MTPDRIVLVQESFGGISAETAAQLFYGRLFEIAPELRSLFGDDMIQQRQKLMTAIAFAVGGLGEIERILPTVEALGARHVDYGVEAEHYEIVGAALLWTLKQALGDDFTEALEEAWSEAYGTLSSAMIRAAERRAA